MILEGEAAPRVKSKPMYVVFHVEFDGIVRIIDFRRDITILFLKKHGTIFCLILVQPAGVIILPWSARDQASKRARA